MTSTFGPQLDAEIAYRRESLLRVATARRGRGWVARLLGHTDDPTAETGRIGRAARTRGA